jgi:hypothetical protein
LPKKKFFFAEKFFLLKTFFTFAPYFLYKATSYKIMQTNCNNTQAGAKFFKSCAPHNPDKRSNLAGRICVDQSAKLPFAANSIASAHTAAFSTANSAADAHTAAFYRTNSAADAHTAAFYRTNSAADAHTAAFYRTNSAADAHTAAFYRTNSAADAHTAAFYCRSRGVLPHATIGGRPLLTLFYILHSRRLHTLHSASYVALTRVIIANISPKIQLFRSMFFLHAVDFFALSPSTRTAVGVSSFING